jgi:hypothetical protein
MKNSMTSPDNSLQELDASNDHKSAFFDYSRLLLIILFRLNHFLFPSQGNRDRPALFEKGVVISGTWDVQRADKKEIHALDGFIYFDIILTRVGYCMMSHSNR